MSRNVKEIRYGRHIIKETVGPRLARYVAISMEVPWGIVASQLPQPPERLFLIQNVEQATVDRLVAESPACDVVVGVGGGQAIDAAKYLAWMKGLPLINIPTIISTNAYVTAAAGIRRNGRVEYLGNVAPDLVVIDFDVIRTAPPLLNISGVGDILSIHTGSRDWEIAAEDGASARNYPLQPEAIRRARAVLAGIAANAQAIAALTDEGIRTVVESFLEINDICIPLGHYRPEEGSEHFFAYNAERVSGKLFLHGSIVGLGIDLMSALQENDHAGICALMDRLGLPHTPTACNLSAEEIRTTLETLPAYVRQVPLWYSIIDRKGIDARFIERALARLFA